MFTEGPSWLPNRIYGNHTVDGCINRVIVIHSPLHLDCREKRVERDNNDLETTCPLLNESTVHQEQLQNESEFLYGMQLLQVKAVQSCKRELSDNCEDHSVQSLYRHVFNVRYVITFKFCSLNIGV